MTSPPSAELEAHRFAFFARAAQAQAEPLPVALDADDLERQQIAFAHDILGMADAPVDELRYVDEALDGPFDARERAERDELGDAADDDLSFLVLVDDVVPLLGLARAAG